MPTTRKRQTKDGTTFYQIVVSRGRGQTRPSMNWYPPQGWGQKAIDRELAKIAAEFERQVQSGDVCTRAEQAARDRQKAIEDAKIKTFQQYCDAVFMPALAARCSENSRANYQSTLNNWIYPTVGDMKLPEITSAEIEALFVKMQNEKMSHSTVVKVYTIFKGVFKAARKKGLISVNPMELVDRPKPRKEEKKSKEPDAYTADEIKYILQCLADEPFQWQVYIHLLTCTGMRRGECGGLEWKNIDFKRGKAIICQTLNYTPQKGVYVDTTKNSKEWEVDIAPYVLNMLLKLRVIQSHTAMSRFVFTQKNSTEPMHPQSPTRYFKKLEKRYGIKDFHPHKLRHSFASISIINGADIASISEILGHSDKAVTLRMYTHADEQSRKRASNIFQNAITA